MEKIKNRFTGEVMCRGLSLKIVLEKHRKWCADEGDGERANLSYADFRGAYLRGADLSYADLRGANLSYADLIHANLSYANLIDASLRSANLRSADLCGANIIDADLSYANLRDAYLSYANLCGANIIDADLRGADLRGADLSDENLRQFKHDVWGVLTYAKSEVPDLIKAIKEGRIDGSQYEGECCCLCGTLEKGLPAKMDIRDANSPAEQWFSMIKNGDTPENNFASEKALEWVQEWSDLMLLEREIEG